MSICVWLSMCPMCRRPVTLGGGRSMVNTGRVSPGAGVFTEKSSSLIQYSAQRASIAPGSYALGKLCGTFFAWSKSGQKGPKLGNPITRRTDFDITGVQKKRSNRVGEDVWRRSHCTHSLFYHREIASVYAGASLAMCVSPASIAASERCSLCEQRKWRACARKHLVASARMLSAIVLSRGRANERRLECRNDHALFCGRHWLRCDSCASSSCTFSLEKGHWAGIAALAQRHGPSGDSHHFRTLVVSNHTLL